MLPFTLISTLFIAFQEKISFPLKTKYQMIILWGGWLFLCLVIFSVAPFIHGYYLSMISIPLSVLTAMGFAEFDRLSKNREIFAVIVLMVATSFTLGFQLKFYYVNMLEMVVHFPLFIFLLGVVFWRTHFLITK